MSHVFNDYRKSLESSNPENQIFLGCNEKLWYINDINFVVNKHGIDKEN